MNGNRYQRRFRQTLPFLCIMPVLAAIICLGIGQYKLSPAQVIETMYQAIVDGGALDAVAYSVVINLRLPRILLALCAGGALAAAGTAYQSVFSNPLAAPDTLGVSAGAGCGACLGLLWNLPSLAIQGLAFAGGLLAVGLTFLISRSRRQSGTVMLVLSGIAVSALFQAMISLVQMTADPTEKLPEITYWLMGSLSRVRYDGLSWGAPFLLFGSGVIYVLRWRLNMLALEDREAISLGIPLRAMRAIIIAMATCVTATSVALCGMVGWLGILAPHIVRMIYGGDNRYVVPAAISVGAIALVTMDTFARCLISGEIPISVLTALAGAPVFILLLRKTGGARL